MLPKIPPFWVALDVFQLQGSEDPCVLKPEHSPRHNSVTGIWASDAVAGVPDLPSAALERCDLLVGPV